MYKEDDPQITLTEFYSPFGELDPDNRWVKTANLIPWQQYERAYAKQFSNKSGAPAIKFRMALGTLLIKKRTGLSDREIVQVIKENPYMQYLIGLHEFVATIPFSASSITNFRKHITKDVIKQIHESVIPRKRK